MMLDRMKNESGFALILTLVVTALMVAVLVEMVHQVYVDVSLSRGFRDGQQASIIAESGVMAVKKALSNGVDPALLAGLLAKPLSDEVGSLGITIIDENGKININALVKGDGTYDDLIKNALLRLTEPLKLQGGDTWGNLLDSVADWIDTDKLQHAGGAETPHYRTLKPAYNAHDGSLATLTELTLVKGITPALLDRFVDEKAKLRLRDCLTIYPRDSRRLPNINVKKAPKAILMALDPSISESVADRIISIRNDFKGPGDFSKVSELNALYNGVWGARLTTASTLFRITAVAKVKESVRIVEAVLSDGNIESWQEYKP